jgi:hypothetical protein
MKKYFSILFLILAFNFSIKAQMDAFPCEKANPELKKLLNGDIITDLYVHGCYGQGLAPLSTSFLKATGKPPAEDSFEDSFEYGIAQADWTCMYSAGSISDGNSTTAWSEGVDGNGIGEMVIVPCIDLNKPVKIWSGLGKTETLFKANSRPKKIKLLIIQAEIKDIGQYGDIFTNVKLIASEEVVLEDKNNYQTISVPAFEKSTYFNKFMEKEEECRYLLGIEILEVYPGSKYQDTCISEVSN